MSAGNHSAENDEAASICHRDRVENIGNVALSFSAVSYPTSFPMKNADNNCTSSTSPASGSACALTIEFKPVSSPGSKTSMTLTEAVKFTTNTLNVPGTTKEVVITCTEPGK